MIDEEIRKQISELIDEEISLSTIGGETNGVADSRSYEFKSKIKIERKKKLKKRTKK